MTLATISKKTEDTMSDTTGTLQKTKNYKQFKILGTNRETSPNHIRRLIKAMQESGNLTEKEAILVNEKMEVIDGQHRLAACRELGQPVYYRVHPGLTVEDARKMNMLRRNWNMDDYAHSYAARQPDYQKYLILKDEYGFSHGIMLHFIRDNHSEKGHYKEFREGDFAIDDLASARARLDHLSEIAELLPELAYESGFAYAVAKAMRVEGYDENQMVSKIRQYGNRLRRYTAVGDNLRQIEELYNHNVSEGNRLRMF